MNDKPGSGLVAFSVAMAACGIVTAIFLGAIRITDAIDRRPIVVELDVEIPPEPTSVLDRPTHQPDLSRIEQHVMGCDVCRPRELGGAVTIDAACPECWQIWIEETTAGPFFWNPFKGSWELTPPDPTRTTPLPGFREPADFPPAIDINET